MRFATSLHTLALHSALVNSVAGKADRSSHREASSSGMISAPCACASTPPGSSASAPPSMFHEEQSAAAWAAASCADAPGAPDCAACRHSSAGDPRPGMATSHSGAQHRQVPHSLEHDIVRSWQTALRLPRHTGGALCEQKQGWTGAVCSCAHQAQLCKMPARPRCWCNAQAARPQPLS